MNNHETYVSLETAKLLKQAGFDWEANTYYQHGILRDGWCSNKNKEDMITCSASTLSIAQKWLREVKGYSIYPTYGGYKIYVLDANDSAGFSRTYGLNSALTYEEAQEAGIKKALELILEEANQ